MSHTLASEKGVVDEANIDGCLALLDAGLSDWASGEPPLEIGLDDLAGAKAPLESEGSPAYDSPLVIIEAEG